MTFSHCAACTGGAVTSSVSSARLAVWSRWLWQVTPYLSNVALAEAAVIAAVPADVCAWRPGDTADETRDRDAIQPLTINTTTWARPGARMNGQLCLIGPTEAKAGKRQFGRFSRLFSPGTQER